LLSFGIEGVPATGYAKLDTKEAGYSPELIVTTVNSAASFTSGTISKPGATGYVFYEDSITADATDPDGDELIFSKVSGPAWISVWSDGTISGVPSNDDTGLSSLTVSVTDGGGASDQATVEVNVTAGTPPTPPSANLTFEPQGDTYASILKPSTAVGTRTYMELRTAGSAERRGFIKFDLTGVHGTVSNAVLHIRSNKALGQLDFWEVDPSWGENTLTWNNMPPMGVHVATVTGVAQGAWVDVDFTAYLAAKGSSGVHAFGITTTRDGYSTMYTKESGSIPTLDLFIVSGGGGGGPANNAPVFTVDLINKPNATEDVAYSDSISGSATDADSDPLTYSKVSGPAWLSVAADGTLSGTPVQADVGANVFTVQVGDGNGGYDSATLNITVDAGPNNAPVFTVDPITGANATEGAAYSDSIAGSATDADSDPLTYSKVSGPAWLVVAAGAGDVGANAFTVQVDDGNGGSDTATLNITVDAAPVNQPPAFSADPFSKANATEGVAYSGSIAGDASDPESDPMTFSKVSGPVWLNVASDGSLSGTPAAGDVGLNAFTVQVDATGGSDTATLNITVDAAPVNNAPTWNADPVIEVDATENTAYSATLANDASDPESDPLTFAKTSGPVWLSVASDGTLSGTPGAGDVGVNSFNVTVSDGINPAVAAVLQITVLAGGGGSATDVYVADIVMVPGGPYGGNRYDVTAYVYLKDGTGAPAGAGFIVTADYTGATTETVVSAGSNGEGRATLKSSRVKNGGTFTITVTDVSGNGYTYNPALNVETTDSLVNP
jgi:hypothetical protein